MLVNAISAAYYTGMRNYAALSWMRANNARTSMISNIGNNVNFGSLDRLAAMDTQLELQAITNSLEYKIANAQLEQIKKEQKEHSKGFSPFA